MTSEGNMLGRAGRARVIWMAVLATVCAGSSGAQAQETGSASQGLLIAEERCAGCHDVTRGAEYSPTFGAPTFEQIALTPGMTATALSAILKTPHRTMPNLMLRSDELGNITAYILNLKND